MVIVELTTASLGVELVLPAHDAMNRVSQWTPYNAWDQAAAYMVVDSRRTYSVNSMITIRLELYAQLQLFSYSSNQPLYHLQRKRFV